MIGVAVFSAANVGERASNDAFLTLGMTSVKLVINEWWGRASDFAQLAAAEPVPLVKLEFTDWMDVVKT